ncbi:MAG: type II secretion system protein GspK [Bryobacteraceae bacterium]|nr:type II secretion system protein GspK [Bryobacteraceae bacterium]
MSTRAARKGGALLAVLWLAAALSAIAFAVASTVRGETERAATAQDGVRSYYLATAGIDRAILYFQWGGILNPDGSPRYYVPGLPRYRFQFPTGEAFVELIPEIGKLNVNGARPDELLRLLLALGAEPARAADITQAIVDWRTPTLAPTAFDAHYLSLTPSFRARHASFEEIEELLLLRGMTPDLFHGSYERNAEGRLLPRPGLRDCLTVYGAGLGMLDINTAEPAVMSAVGIPPDAIAMIMTRRLAGPILPPEAANFARMGPALQRLTVVTYPLVTLRSTARLRLGDGKLSDLRRTVSAVVKLAGKGAESGPTTLRWYDNATPGPEVVAWP